MIIKHFIKKSIALTALLTISQISFADASLVKIGGGVQFVSSETDYDNNGTEQKIKDATINKQYLQIQHSVPFVPNYRYTKYSYTADYESSSAELKIDHSNHELFYAFDFLFIEVQIGGTSNTFEIDDNEFKSTGLTTQFIIDIPLSPITPSINISKGSDDDEKVDSAGINIGWSIAPGFRLDLGAKNYTYTTKTTTIENIIKNNTVYLGLSFNLGL